MVLPAAAISTDWKGGLLGNPYTTTVRWEFNERRHSTTVVQQNTANIVYSPDGLNALDKVFENQVYPAVMR